MSSGGWIKFDKDMDTDPRLADAARVLLEHYVIARRASGGEIDLSNGDASRFMRNALRGAVVTLWCYADEHIRDDDVIPCDAQSLDAIVGLDGFCDAMPNEWVTVRDDGLIELPGYCEKNGLISKKKKLTRGAERQRRYRERTKASRNANVTRHEQRYMRITPGGDLDQDLDQDLDLNTHKKGASVTPANRDFEFVGKIPATVSDSELADGYAEFVTHYPRRSVEHSLLDEREWQRRVRDGDATMIDLAVGAERYAAYVTGGGVSGPQYVMAIRQFLAMPDRRWTHAWDPPKGKAELAQDQNIAATQEWLARSGAHA